LLALLHHARAVAPVQQNNLDSLIKDEQLKFVFVGGKGGVGKTTSSSAIASQLSLSSRRVLLISTDPAHSLSDAFRMQFSNVPRAIEPELPNLEVMEVNPTEVMRRELAGWAELAKELGYDPSDGQADAGEAEGGLGRQLHGFQEWLSGIPGIDEATALSSAIENIESGRYDMIVFDTAPTGHTLKLLELPKILQAGLDKLEGWQATLWGYWEMFKGLAGGSSAESGGVKEKVARRLREYKASIGRVASMITNRTATRFVVVCIAEYLSISESRRLLAELDRFEVTASHVVVNQLVTDYLEEPELVQLEELAEEMAGGGKGPLLEKALAAARLTSARRSIQAKYLRELKACPEVNRQPDPDEPQVRTNRKAGTEPLVVLEVPLLPSEVTGAKAILAFSHHLVGRDLSAAAAAAAGGPALPRKRRPSEEPAAAAAQGEAAVPASGAKAKAVEEEAAKASKRKKKAEAMKKAVTGVMDQVTSDPELAEMIKGSPKLKKIAEDLMANPSAAMQYMMKYMGDPEVSPFLQKAMGKLMGSDKLKDSLGGLMGPGKGGKRRKSGKQGLSPEMLSALGKMGRSGSEL